MYLNMGENMVANGEHEKISIGRVLVSVSTPHAVGGGVEGQHVFDEEHRQAGQLQGARKGDKERGAGGSGVPLA